MPTCLGTGRVRLRLSLVARNSTDVLIYQVGGGAAGQGVVWWARVGALGAGRQPPSSFACIPLERRPPSSLPCLPNRGIIRRSSDSEKPRIPIRPEALTGATMAPTASSFSRDSPPAVTSR